MRTQRIGLSLCLAISVTSIRAQGTVPKFEFSTGQNSYTLPGQEPSRGGTSTIPTVLVPINLNFTSAGRAGQSVHMDGASDVRPILRSPIFSRFRFGPRENTQYADAMLHATFPDAQGWHTLLGKPKIMPVTISIPPGFGYLLTSRRSGTFFGVVDIEYLQRELFKQIPRQEGSLVIAVAHNTTFYAYGDATVCCSWGTHGVDSATGNSFVIGSYLRDAPAIVKDRDVQPLTEQLAEFVNDPLHDPLLHVRRGMIVPGNIVPAWLRPLPINGGISGGCGGSGIASSYVLLEPTDRNPRSDFPESKPFLAIAGGSTWHLQNVALLSWYAGAAGSFSKSYSFPDAHTLGYPATPCPIFGANPAAVGRTAEQPQATAVPVPRNRLPDGHRLIGYWVGRRGLNPGMRLRDVPPQWDVVLVAFAAPQTDAPEGALEFRLPPGVDADQFRSDVALLQSQGRKVMISLGGGGKYLTVADPKSIPNFVSSVARIVGEYGFDGIDLDFETPSLALDPGDTNFKHPTTPSLVNLISALRQLREHFGPGFMISLVPEGTQIPAGFVSYGGQFGSYLPLLWGIHDILSFVDVQDYNTPPLEGLDGEIYQLGSVDYHAAMTELLLHGFAVGQNPKNWFPPLPANQVAVGFLVGATTPAEVTQAMDYIIRGRRPAGTTYKLRKAAGYPEMMGAMFWTIDADRADNYTFSNKAGPQLHADPAAK